MIFRLYVIDGDDAVRDSIATLLPLADMEVRAYATGAAFLDALPQTGPLLAPPAAVLCEARLPDQSGLAVLEELERRELRCPFALLVSNQDQASRRLHRRVPVITKPIVHRRLLAFTAPLIAVARDSRNASETTD